MRITKLILFSLVLLQGFCLQAQNGHSAFAGYCTSDSHFETTTFTIPIAKNREEALKAIAKYFPDLDWQTTAGLTLVVTLDLLLNPNFVHADLYKAEYNFELRNAGKDLVQLEVSGLICSTNKKKRVREIEKTFRKLLK